VTVSRLSTYDESKLKQSKVSFQGKCVHTGIPLKLPSPTKLGRLGHFPPARQAGRRAGPVFYTVSFLWVLHGTHSPKTELYTGRFQFVCAVDPCLEFSLEPLAAGHLTLLLPLLRPYLQKTRENYRIFI
jgi:hypothetical protein